MKKRKAAYTDDSIGKIKIVDDFLPKPEDLVLKEETKKIIGSFEKSMTDFKVDKRGFVLILFSIMLKIR